MDRAAQLRKFIESSPEEPFPRYALALELKGRGDAAGAVRQGLELGLFGGLGMLLQTLGRAAEARQALTAGQELARRKGDGHTLSELSAALEALDPSP